MFENELSFRLVEKDKVPNLNGEYIFKELPLRKDIKAIKSAHSRQV